MDNIEVSVSINLKGNRSEVRLALDTMLSALDANPVQKTGKDLDSAMLRFRKFVSENDSMNGPMKTWLKANGSATLSKLAAETGFKDDVRGKFGGISSALTRVLRKAGHPTARQGKGDTWYTKRWSQKDDDWLYVIEPSLLAPLKKAWGL